MSQFEKLLKRLYSKPKDFTYDEMKKLLGYYGFYEDNKGKTSGSKVKFENNRGKEFILHKPHPNNVLKQYIIKELLKFLMEEGFLDE